VGAGSADRPWVLVVDDEANMLTTLQFILEGAGYRVSCVSTAAEALAVLDRAASHPSLVITDVQMPGMTGPELLAELGRRRLRVPTLVITGYMNREMLEGLRRAGCEELLEKPFEEEDLLARVARLAGAPGPPAAPG
jgi:two-component system C4-dicarboxylate transport response regulator DctD